MQGRKLFVGNLAYSVTREELEQLFLPFGKVLSVNIIKDKGFGFPITDCVRRGGAVYDMVYASEPTRLILDAVAQGLVAADGLAMLAGQGEVAFELWFGCPPPAGTMQKALGI